MVSIQPGSNYVTQINSIKVKPEAQEQLVKLMTEQVDQAKATHTISERSR